MHAARAAQCYPPAMLFFLAMLLATAEPSLAAIAEPAGGTVGFAAMELATGRMLGLNRNQPLPMQSVFKLPIAIEVLHQVDEGKIALDQEILLEEHALKNEVVRNLFTSLNWYETQLYLQELGVNRFVECGSGKGIVKNARFIEGDAVFFTANAYTALLDTK